MNDTKSDGMIGSDKHLPPWRVPFSNSVGASSGKHGGRLPEPPTQARWGDTDRNTVRVNRGLREFVVVLVVLFVGCLALGAVVWWQLLS